MAAYFDDIRHDHPEIATLSLADARGSILASSARSDFTQLQVTPVRLMVAGQPVAEVRVGVDRGFIAARIAGMRFDMAIVLLTSMLIAFEVLLFLAARHNVFTPGPVSAMPRQSSAENRVAKVRMLTFLFIFAELLLRIFLPLYGSEFVLAGSGLSVAAASSLPLSVYLLCAALAMPRAGRWSVRVGRRHSYLIGALVNMVGTILAGVTTDFYVLLAGRAAAGVGFAIMFMTCQGYIADDPDASGRSRGAAMFVSAIMVAEICGPAVGGILADRIGYRPVFLLSAVLSIVAMWIGARVLDDRNARTPEPTTAGASLSALRRLLANRRFSALCFLSGVPSKILYVGFLSYLVPVMLTQGGATKSEIGRYAMIYGLLVLGLSPAFAWLAERYRAHAKMVGAGGMLSGAGLLLFVLEQSSEAILCGIVTLGIAQAMSLTAQFILVSDLARKLDSQAGGATGTFRLIERLGSAAGCAVAGALLACFGAVAALATLGGFSMLCSLLFAVQFRRDRSAP